MFSCFSHRQGRGDSILVSLTLNTLTQACSTVSCPRNLGGLRKLLLDLSVHVKTPVVPLCSITNTLYVTRAAVITIPLTGPSPGATGELSFEIYTPHRFLSALYTKVRMRLAHGGPDTDGRPVLLSGTP